MSRLGMTTDQMAVRLLLADDQAGLTALAARLDKIRNPECPDCGPGTQVEDNGAAGIDLTYCCTTCGHQFDAYPE